MGQVINCFKENIWKIFDIYLWRYVLVLDRQPFLFHLKQASLTGRPTTLESKRFQDFLKSVGLVLNSIQGRSTILCLKKEAVGL